MEPRCLIIIFFFFGTSSLLAQNLKIDSIFQKRSGGAIHSMAVQPNGKILIGGIFRPYGPIDWTYNGFSHLIRLNTDQSLDNSFNPTGTGPDGDVNSIVLQPNGKILIGGWFSTYDGIDHFSMARLNSDGSLDDTFTLDTSLQASFINAIIYQENGKILVGGLFHGNSTGLVRLNAGGAVDQSFIVSKGHYSEVKSICVQPDGKILIGGSFNSLNDVKRNKIARLNTDGSLDETFDPGKFVDSNMLSIALQPDGKILVGGVFTYNKAGLMRLNSDGTLDENFKKGDEYDGYIKSILLLRDGKILIGGSFDSYHETERKFFTRLNPDGSVDESFNPPSISGVVNSIIFHPNGKILLGGKDGVGRNRILQIERN
jgi:uncharacterized delta-60 repeat protein